MIALLSLYMKQPTYYDRLELLAHDCKVCGSRVEGSLERKCRPLYKLRINYLGRTGGCEYGVWDFRYLGAMMHRLYSGENKLHAV